jgi:hypothetical protein
MSSNDVCRGDLSNTPPKICGSRQQHALPDRPKMLAMAGSRDENAKVGKILPKTI